MGELIAFGILSGLYLSLLIMYIRQEWKEINYKIKRGNQMQRWIIMRKNQYSLLAEDFKYINFWQNRIYTSFQAAKKAFDNMKPQNKKNYTIIRVTIEKWWEKYENN